MATEFEIDENLINNASTEEIQEAKDLLQSLGITDDEIVFTPEPQASSSFENMQTYNISAKNNVLGAIKDFFGSNNNVNMCEVGWDAFAVAAKAACASLTPAGAAIAMIVINRFYLKMRANCK